MRVLFFLIFTALLSFNGLAQIKLSVEGKDFWFSIMPNFASSSGANSPANDAVLLTISSKHNTSGVVENPAMGYSVPFTVTAFGVTEIQIPNNVAASLNSQIIDSTAIHIYSEDTITAFVANMQAATRDATNLIPTQALGNEYMVTAYAVSSIGLSQFIIVSTEDDMDIKITPSVNTAGGSLAGVPFNISLDRGQVYLVQGDSSGFDLTGTTVTSLDSGTNCSNFAVFAGSSCTNIPLGCYACDQVFSILPPIAAWGNEYLLAPFQIDSLSTYRVTALHDNSDIFIDGNFVITLNSGDHYEVNNDSNARCIFSDSLISVTQFMQGIQCSSDGDPAMLVINSTSQGVYDAIFTTIDVNGTSDTNFATIITNHAGIGTVEFDGNLLDSNTFIQFQECSEFYYAYIPLAIGAHVVHSSEQFSLYIYGMTSADSYAYSAGSTVFIKGEIEEATCSYSRTTFFGDSLLSFYWWHRLETPGDTLSTELNLTLTSPIAPGLYVFSGFSPVSGCKEDVYYKVTEPMLGIGVQALSDPEFVCNGDEVQLSFIERVSAVKYSFEDSANVALFSIFDNVEISSSCGAIGNRSLTFNGNQTRAFATPDMNTTLGGFIEFAASVAQNSCDLPGTDDTLFVDYSNNAGTNWILLDSLFPVDYPDFKRFRATLPSAAETAATRFRVRQAGSYAADEDIWVIDRFGVYVLASNFTDSVRWTPSLMVSDSLANSPIGFPTDSTVFTVYFKDTSGCVYSDSILVQAPDTLVTPVDFDTLKCDNVVIPFVASHGGGVYEWKPSVGVSDPTAKVVSLSNTESTEYIVKIVDPFGCDSVYQKVNVDVKYKPNVSNFKDTSVCDGGTVQFVINDTTATILWSDGSSDNVLSVNKTGTYWYTASNECGTDQDTIDVVSAKRPTLELGPDLVLCPNQPLTLELTDEGNSYFWSDGNTGVRNEFTYAGTFTVTVTSPEGCTSVDSLKVKEDCETIVNYPNVFSPNGDGVNDIFHFDVENALKVEFWIYNRWGQQVFYTNVSSFGWDGTVNGEPASEGTYFLHATVLTSDSHFVEHKGSVTLVRD